MVEENVKVRATRVAAWCAWFAVAALAVGCIAPGPIPGTPGTAQSYGPEVDAAIRSLTLERKEHGKGAPSVIADLVSLAADDAVELERGATSSDDAVKKLLRQAIFVLGNRGGSLVVRGWFLQSTSLDGMGFPPEVVRGALVKVGMGIVHPKAGGPYGVLLVAEIPGDVLVNPTFDL
jgi:hypothetical protein